VFLDDLGVVPAPRPIELGHHDPTVFQEHLEDPVFVRVELQHTAVAAQPHRVQRGQDLLRIESGIVQSVAQRPVLAVDDDTTQIVRDGRELVVRTDRAAQTAETTVGWTQFVGAVAWAPSPKKESCMKPESCHKVVLPRRRDPGVLAVRRPDVGAGCGPLAVAPLCGTSSCSSGMEGRWSIEQRR